MHRSQRMAIGLLLSAAVFSSGCYGPFYLTRKVWKFNGEVSDNKWIVEVAYLLMTWLPVYGLAGAADAIIFNSIEFWTGNNPLAEGETSSAPATRRIVRGDVEAVVSKVQGDRGPELLIEQFHNGQSLGSLRVQRDGQATVGLDSTGAAVFRAETLADGSIVVTDRSGQRVARYTGRQAEQLAASIQ